MTETYKGHEIKVIQDQGGWYARIDGHDEPLEDTECKTEQQALEQARQLVDCGWF